NIDPGEYYLWLRCRNGIDPQKGQTTFGIVPMDDGKPMWEREKYLAGEFEKFQEDLPETGPDMFNVDRTMTIPDMSGYEYTSRCGDRFYLPDHDKLEVAGVLGVSDTVNLVSVGGARLDEVSEYDETTTGYIDGSLDSSAGIEYSWEGEPFNSITFAENDEPDAIVIAPPVAELAYDPPQCNLLNHQCV